MCMACGAAGKPSLIHRPSIYPAGYLMQKILPLNRRAKRFGCFVLATGILLAGFSASALVISDGALTLRFSSDSVGQGQVDLAHIPPNPPADQGQTSPANSALKADNWEQVWGDEVEMFFGGSGASQYLAIEASQGGYVWARSMENSFKLSERPMLQITWAVDQFTGPGLKYWDSWDRPVVVFVAFGKQGMFAPPKSIGFVWGNDADEIRAIPECLPKSERKKHKQKCFRFHKTVRYFVVNNGEAGKVKRDQFDLIQYYKRAYPGENPEAAIVYAVSIEAKAKSGESSIERLYDITLAPADK